MNSGYNAIQLVDGAVNAAIRNTIISISGSVAPFVVDSSSQSGFVADYNCYHNRNGSVAGPGAHSINADPRFVSPAAGDFHLQSPTSPCIDAGIDLGLPYAGNAPDIGCYETTSSYLLWTR